LRAKPIYVHLKFITLSYTEQFYATHDDSEDLLS
jgi:hypothetical protein